MGQTERRKRTARWKERIREATERRYIEERWIKRDRREGTEMKTQRGRD
jgi:hypothetical protein